MSGNWHSENHRFLYWMGDRAVTVRPSPEVDGGTVEVLMVPGVACNANATLTLDRDGARRLAAALLDWAAEDEAAERAGKGGGAA